MAVHINYDPQYGHYPWWPENGNDWVHPEDVELARSLIPSPRVFRRNGEHEGYILLYYGDLCLRVRRTLWCKVPWEGFDIGDLVEVRTRGMQNEHRTGTIRDMLWDRHAGTIKYHLNEVDNPIDTPLTAADLKHVEPPKRHEEIRIEPREDLEDDLDANPDEDLA